jgi:hypothetical protein
MVHPNVAFVNPNARFGDAERGCGEVVAGRLKSNRACPVVGKSAEATTRER